MGEERGRSAGGKDLEPGGNLTAGPPKGGDPMLVMGPSSGSAATHGGKGGAAGNRSNST